MQPPIQISKMAISLQDVQEIWEQARPCTVTLSQVLIGSSRSYFTKPLKFYIIISCYIFFYLGCKMTKWGNQDHYFCFSISPKSVTHLNFVVAHSIFTSPSPLSSIFSLILDVTVLPLSIYLNQSTALTLCLVFSSYIFLSYLSRCFLYLK